MEIPDVIRDIELLNDIEWLEEKIKYCDTILKTTDFEKVQKGKLNKLRKQLVEYKSRKAMLEQWLYPQGK